MAGGRERVLRRRIRSVQATKKITRAMELIAASRIVRAQQRVAAARPYSEQITEVIRHLASAGAELSHPLLTANEEPRKVAMVVVTSDRGLAGAYNANVIRAGERALREHVQQGREYSLVLVGRKGENYFRFKRYTIDHAFHGMSDQPTYEDARAVGQRLLTAFEEGEVDRVELAYTQFLSLGSQRPIVRRLMPLDPGALTEARDEGDAVQALYEFEPEPSEILSRLLPRYVEARLFASMLDAAASEHAARQRAMKSATDNAEDMIVRLTRSMNRARQDSITTEIMEIVGGAEALRRAGGPAGDLLPDYLGSRELFFALSTRHLVPAHHEPAHPHREPSHQEPRP